MNFASYLKSFRSMWGTAAAAAAAGPMVLRASALDPPWPPGSAAQVATLFCAVALLLAYAVCLYLVSSDRRRGSGGNLPPGKILPIIGAVFLVAGIASATAYLWNYSSVVVTDSATMQGKELPIRKVIGTDLRSGIIDQGTPPLDLLRDHLYDEEAIWTPQSLRHSRFTLLGSFCSCFFALTFGTAILAAAKEESHSNAPAKPKGTEGA